MKKKDKRRAQVLDFLSNQLISGKKNTKEGEVALTPSDRQRIKTEIGNINSYLSGKKKKGKVKGDQQLTENKEKWFIDIFTISYGYTKRSVRRKNKGKSRKKMKREKSVTFLKTVVLQQGMMQSYREGRMGISPKNHSFRLRKEEPLTY